MISPHINENCVSFPRKFLNYTPKGKYIKGKHVKREHVKKEHVEELESSWEGVDREAGLGKQTGRAHERRVLGQTYCKERNRKREGERGRGKERGGEERRRGIYLTVNCEFVTALLHYSTGQVAMYEACQNLGPEYLIHI